MSRLNHFGPTGDGDKMITQRYSRGRSNTGLPDDWGFHQALLVNDSHDLYYDEANAGSGTTAARVFRNGWIRVNRYPTVETTFWSTTLNTGATVHATISPGGTVQVYYRTAGFPGTLIGGMSAPLLKRWTQYAIMLWCKVDTSAGNERYIKFYAYETSREYGGFDCTYDVGTTGTTWYLTKDTLGRAETNSPSMDIEYSNWILDTDTFSQAAARISSVQCAANGTFSAWTNAGIADWRARNTWPGIGNSSAGATTGIRTTTSAQKQTYLMESFSAAGITGRIYGARAHVYFAQAPGTTPSLIVIRNGAEVDTVLPVQSNSTYLSYRIDSAFLWEVGDTIEIGILSSAGTTRIGSIYLSVEHDTPVPEIAVEDAPTLAEVSWTGNDTVQTVALPFEPQFILWWPRSASTPGGFWAARWNTAHYLISMGVSQANLVVRGASLYLVGDEGNGANSNGVVYDAIVLHDPGMRMFASGGYYDQAVFSRDDEAVDFETPTGVPFAPECAVGVQETIGTTTFARFYGPGISTDLAVPWDTGTAGGGAANYIQELTDGGIVAGYALHTQIQQTGLFGFRRGGLTQEFLIDVLQYTGNGAGGTRVIPVDVSGLTVAWAIVVPIAAATRVIMNGHQAGGKNFNSSGGALANSITALGADSITVGTALNTNAVVYSVLVFALGPSAGTPCGGTGTVAAGTDPTDGASLATATAPHAWMEIAVGGTTYRWAKTAINATVPKTPRVLSFGNVGRSLTDGRGSFESSHATVTLADYDRVLRGLHGTSALMNKPVSIYVQDEASIRAGGNPWRIFKGVVRDFRPDAGLTYRIEAEDALTLKFGSGAGGGDLLVPQLLVSTDISDNNPTEKVTDTPVPACYGNLSDEDADDPVGTVFCPFIGAESVATDPLADNTLKFMVGRGALADIQSVWLADPTSGDPIVVRARVALESYGDQVMSPFKSGWFEPDDYSDRSGVRYTFVYLRESDLAETDLSKQVADLAETGRIPLLVNCCGRETTGDATGSAIGSLARQFMHVLNNEVLQVATGNWLSQYQFDGYALLNTASFEAARTASIARIGGAGYLGAFVLGHSFKQVSVRTLIEQFCRSGDMDLGISRHGQILCVLLDRSSTASTATTYTDQSDILRDSFSIDPHLDEIENVVQYVYARNYVPALQLQNPEQDSRLPREPFDGTWLSTLQSLPDATSISDLGEERASAVQEYEMVRDQDTADDVAAQRLALRCPVNGRAEATFSLRLGRGLAIELGDIIKVTHFQGIGASGWSARRCQVRRHVVDLDAMTVTLTVRDVHDLMA